jgi:hypothetical protein
MKPVPRSNESVASAVDHPLPISPTTLARGILTSL